MKENILGILFDNYLNILFIKNNIHGIDKKVYNGLLIEYDKQTDVKFLLSDKFKQHFNINIDKQLWQYLCCINKESKVVGNITTNVYISMINNEHFKDISLSKCKDSELCFIIENINDCEYLNKDRYLMTLLHLSYLKFNSITYNDITKEVISFNNDLV